MRFQSIPAVTSESALGAEILRDKNAKKETAVDQRVTAVISMRDAHLSLEHESGRMLPKPVLYMHGVIQGIKGNGLPDGVEYCRLSDTPDEQAMRGTDVYVRYEFSELQTARAVARGVGLKDWSGLDQRLLTNAHELPVSCDITTVTTERSQVPFIVVDVNDRMGLTYNRKTSGYDYADLVGISPTLMREANPQLVQQLDKMLKGMDYQAMMAQSQVEQKRPATREVKPTHYEQRVFDDIFGAETEREERLQAEREREAAETQERTLGESEQKAQQQQGANAERPAEPERSLGHDAVDAILKAREERRKAVTAEEIEKAREEAQKAAEASQMSLFDELSDEIAEEDEQEDGITGAARRAVKNEQRQIAEAAATHDTENPFAEMFMDLDEPEQPSDDGLEMG